MFCKFSKCVLSKCDYLKKAKHLFYNVSHYAVNLHVNDINIGNYIRELQKEYERLKCVNSSVLLPEQEKRLSELQPTITTLQLRQSLIDNIANLKCLMDDKDPDIRQLAEEECRIFNGRLQCVDDQLLQSLLPHDDSDSCNAIILEISAGVGGQEAMLFAKELFEMYSSFVDYKGWNIEIAEYFVTDIGGIRHASALINGDRAYQYFKYEAGVHRVQRIPATEKSGRIHTSTASVLALPQPTDIQIVINNNDLRIETKRATGAGGQHVNTTDSAVRITHLPTQLSVDCQIDRSQHKNKAIALQRLRTLLYNRQLQSQMDSLEATKKSQVRSNFRNEKIRTYNFNQDRITDHRLQGNNVHNLKAFFEGGILLENVITKLHNITRIEILLKMVEKLTNQKPKLD